jgi:hypothetical protein
MESYDKKIIEGSQFIDSDFRVTYMSYPCIPYSKPRIFDNSGHILTTSSLESVAF